MTITSPVPAGLRVPFFYASFDPSMAGFSQPVQRTLIIGQSINAAVSVPVFCPSFVWARSVFGAGSQLANMVRDYLANDPAAELWVLPYNDNPAGSTASGSTTFAGTVTLAGTVPGYVDGVGVTSAANVGDTASIVAAAHCAAINADTDLPITATVSGATVTYTSNWKGTSNAIPIVFAYHGTQGGEAIPTGITISVTPMSAGTGDPVLTGLAAAINDQPFDFFIHPWANTVELAITSALLAERWGYTSQVYGGVFTARTVDATASTLIAFTGALNDPYLNVLGVIGSPCAGYRWAAAWGGANAQWIKNQPNLPLRGRAVVGMLAPPLASRFNFATKQSLLSAGCALVDYDQAGNVFILRTVTTFQTTTTGQPSQAYLDVGTPYTLMSITRSARSMTEGQFSNCILVPDGTKVGPGVNACSPSGYKAALAAAYAQMELDGLVTSAAAMIAATVVQINSQDPTRLDVLWAPFLAPGLEIVNLVCQFRLQAPAATS